MDIISDKIKLLEEKTEVLYQRMANCDICPRNCGVNRLNAQKGYCGIDSKLVVYTAFLHSGEEPVISGNRGSGTIFFSGCNLKCCYCQNYKFSHKQEGKIINEQDLAKIMLKLQEKGAHNINFVTPTHLLPQILTSLHIAFKAGLTIPLVYNTSGYEKSDIISFIGDIFDIYLADIRYITPELSKKYSNARDYPLFNLKSIKTMYDQKNNYINPDGLMEKGLIIRNLVLPGNVEESIKILTWIKKNTPGALLSIMSQYQPYFEAKKFPQINRRIFFKEYDLIAKFLENSDLEGWIQDLTPNEKLAGIYFNPHLENLF